MIKLFESYNNLAEVKNEIFLAAVDTENIELIEFFLNKGYDINNDGVLTSALQQHSETLRFLLEKGLKVEYNQFDDNYLRDLEVQKVLIDFGYDFLLYDKVGFNNGLLADKKYADKVKAVDDMTKYNL